MYAVYVENYTETVLSGRYVDDAIFVVVHGFYYTIAGVRYYVYAYKSFCLFYRHDM